MSKKTRKKALAAGEPVADAAVVQPVQPAQLEYEFFFLPTSEPEPVDERDLHDLMKWWRHGRATKTIWQAISDGYVFLFTAVVISAMLVSVVVDAQTGQAGCDTLTCATAKTLLPAATCLACYALTLSVARMFGPILASAA
ncbi:MAG: ABC transporter permease, partial [Propionibacteriaceae bacterium]|nr:ABC transporter permease [Propionibacteriaceae bacterium]